MHFIALPCFMLHYIELYRISLYYTVFQCITLQRFCLALLAYCFVRMSQRRRLLYASRSGLDVRLLSPFSVGMGRPIAISVSPFSATVVVLLVIVWSSSGHGDRQDQTNTQFHHGLDPTVAISRNPEKFREDGAPLLVGLGVSGNQRSLDGFEAIAKKEKRRMPFRSDLGKRFLGPKYALQLPVVLEEEDSEWKEVKDAEEKRGKRYRNFKADLGKRSSPLDRGFADDFDVVAGFNRDGYQEKGEEEPEDREDGVDLSKRRMFRSDLG